MKSIFRKKRNIFVEPDEIFLDSTNLPQFDTQQFEGRIEHPIPKINIKLVGIITFIIFISFGIKLSALQISQGEKFLEQSRNNSLDHEPLFADRGIIYDRNGTELAWNEKSSIDQPFSIRKYISEGGFGHLLGYVSYPTKDKTGYYWQSEFIGKDGIEKVYDDTLHGQNGVRIIEKDVAGNVLSHNIVNNPLQGNNVTLTVDSRIQSTFNKELQKVIDSGGYSGGSALMMDVRNGEILMMTSYPEYKPEILSLGDDSKTISGYFTDSRKPFINRALQGLYSPGSIVKPFMAIAALTEGVVDENTQILSRGSISIPNPYNPKLSSVFKDLADDNGWVDIRNALKVSSNIYFYEVGGGYKNQRGIGIGNIEKYARSFGIGEKTGINFPGEKEGVIPSPQWKKKYFPGDPWRIGDTYHTVIGQYGFQVTPIQMLRAVSSIANGGTLYTPHFLESEPGNPVKLPYDEHYFKVVQEGMHLVATVGTAHTLSQLPFSLGAKTGTAEVGVLKNKINSWMMGFFPYENPKYAFVINLERGPSDVGVNVRSVAINSFTYLYSIMPEFFQ